MKYLITGGAGFIGSNFVPYFVQKYPDYEIINLGGGEPITLKRMIQTIEKAVGKPAKIEQKPMQPGDVDKTVCDWSKAHKLLHYTPQTTFEQGIQKFVKWRQR